MPLASKFLTSNSENAPDEYADRQTLWNAVHQIEKAKNAQLWREIEVALPKELSREEQIETVREFVKGLTEKGMCADWSLHDKCDGNPHAHIMLTMRSIESDGKWAAKSRKVYVLDENGERIFQKVDKSGRKQYKSYKVDYNDWNERERVEEWRATWAKCCNVRLAECNQIDHRSYARQGIDQVPTIHEGYVARKRVEVGLSSERVDINKKIRQKNNLLQLVTGQLKSIEEEINQIIANQNKEKGSVLSGRVAELFTRRQRTLNNRIIRFERGTSDGKRTIQSREQEVAKSDERPTSTDTDIIIRQAETIIDRSETDQNAIRLERTDTSTVIRQSETKVEVSSAGRIDREAKQQRLRAEESRRIAEQLEREREEIDEQSKKKSREGFSL